MGSRRIGIIVIGRNEGDRLPRCLASLADVPGPVVYVDSASSDDSVTHARAARVEIVELDATRPLTAARARNAGVDRLIETAPGTDFVQFVDGDCTIEPGWIEAARDHLAGHDDVVVVTGHLREREPDASVYQRLCDLEWRGPVGELRTCGGVFMVRLEAFQRVKGFASTMVAGEEPELCGRLRADGGRVWRLDRAMGRHDGLIMSFGQWWRRARRGGHAYAERAWQQRGGTGWLMRRRVLSILFWGGLPVLGLAAAWPTRGISAAVAAAGLAWLGVRVAWVRRRNGDRARDARLYAGFCVLGKLAEAVGVLGWWFRRDAGHGSFEKRVNADTHTDAYTERAT